MDKTITKEAIRALAKELEQLYQQIAQHLEYQQSYRKSESQPGKEAQAVCASSHLKELCQVRKEMSLHYGILEKAGECLNQKELAAIFSQASKRVGANIFSQVEQNHPEYSVVRQTAELYLEAGRRLSLANPILHRSGQGDAR